MAGLIPEATLANKGLMGTSDKSFMPFAMDASGGKIYLIGSVKQYQIYSILIITPFNNSKTATMSLLNTGYGASINPGLKIISGNKIAGKFYYKVDEDKKVMNIYYKAPEINAGPLDILISFYNSKGTVKYSEYDGSTEDMTEIVLTD